MSKLLTSLLVLTLFAPGAARAEDDCDGCKDLPYITRMPGYYLSTVDASQFNAQEFFDGKQMTTFEGRRYILQYFKNSDAVRASTLQIVRNHANAFKRKGTVVFQGVCAVDGCGEWKDWNIAVGKITVEGRETWIMVEPHDDGSYYKIYVLEREEMKQDVEVITSDDMRSALSSAGHIALDIHFESDRAVLKSDAAEVIEQIVKLLNDNPELVISIEGHTDNTGDPKLAQKLSDERAKAVLSALTKQGVASKRLKAKGWGQTKPIADNGTDEGRAKNRRVELVKAN